MAELGVRHEHAVDDERGADAGAERRGDDEALLALGRAELLFGEARGVRVVDDGDGAAGRFGEHGGHVDADPRLVEVRHEVERLAGLDGGRERDADGRGFGHFEVVELLAHDLGDRVRSGHLGGEDLQTGFGEFPLLQIDGRGLDAGAADIDAERLCGFNHRRFSSLYRIS